MAYSMMDAAQLVPLRDDHEAEHSMGEALLLKLTTMPLEDMLSTLVVPVNQVKDDIVSTWQGLTEMFMQKHEDEDVTAFISRGAAEALIQFQDVHETAVTQAKHKDKKKHHFLERLIKRWIKKVLKKIAKKLLKEVIKLGRWVIEKIFKKAFSAVIDWFVRPVLVEVLEFIGLNPELWPFVAVAGGLALLGGGLYELFFKSGGSAPPSDVGPANIPAVNEQHGASTSLTAPAPSTVSPSAKTAAPARPYGGAVASMAPASSRVSVSAPETTETLLSKGNQLLGKESLTVQQAIEEASKRVGVDAGILTAFAYKESTFEAGAKASTSSAAGLFQFLKGTWKQVVGAYGDMYGVSQDASPLDPLAAAIMGAAFIKHEIYPSISKVVPNPTVTDLYLGHFMGPSAGAHWLKNYKDNPNALAYLDWPDAAASNQWVYYDKGGNPRTYAEIYSIFTGSMSAVEAAYDARAKVNTTTNSTSIKTTPSTATPVAPITGTAPAGTAQATGGPVGSDAPPKTLINTKAGIYAVNS